MNNRLKQTIEEASKIFILTDENVAPFWLPETEYWFDCENAVEITIRPGEKYKNLQSVQRIWKTLMKHHADRNALLINLGGGVITDLGGFAASTYKRGIRFINIPTTLLAMVDAAIGGKTGIDFGGGKNQIGTFAEAEDVLIHQDYLMTLPQRELLSGMAEMLKYGFIADAKLLEINLVNYEQFIFRCGDIKRKIVAKDPTEKGLRKILNFGHTMGHAIESHCLTTETPLLHGEAMALGMGAALWLSERKLGLDADVLQRFESQIKMLLSEVEVSLSGADVEPILQYLVHDKKNKNNKPQFVLLEAVGKPIWDVEVEPDSVMQALNFIIGVVK
ncbi:MAG: 3-dehydroquinate synthase [Bacteroidales bacterium]|nr:3-dehydroquinate synthase [Bacteroidales bacterium]